MFLICSTMHLCQSCAKSHIAGDMTRSNDGCVMRVRPIILDTRPSLPFSRVCSLEKRFLIPELIRVVFKNIPFYFFLHNLVTDFSNFQTYLQYQSADQFVLWSDSNKYRSRFEDTM